MGFNIKPRLKPLEEFKIKVIKDINNMLRLNGI